MAKVIKMFDYREAELPEQLFRIKVHANKVEEGLQEAANHFIAIEAQSGPVMENDIVAVQMKSEKPWLDSECARFRVGRKFFYPEIEESVLQHKAGDTWTCVIDGSDVEVTVLSVKRRVAPKLTDELVRKLDMDGMETVADYTEYVKEQLIEEDKEKKQGALCTLVNRQIVEKSEFEMEPDEVENMYQAMYADFQDGAETEEEFENLLLHLYHVKNMDDAKVEMRKQVDSQLKLLAVAKKLAEEKGVSWNEDDYEEFIQANANERMPEEVIRESISMEDFLTQQRVDYLQNLEMEYFDDRFTVEEVE